ncbi:MAG: hypothetical protein E6K53_12255 [Gammaproteobacteria bacterium]|nr:MAG: hypothetical protein E6K53_12255 [Gammaproteobacteria bacterium]
MAITAAGVAIARCVVDEVPVADVVVALPVASICVMPIPPLRPALQMIRTPIVVTSANVTARLTF